MKYILCLICFSNISSVLSVSFKHLFIIFCFIIKKLMLMELCNPLNIRYSPANNWVGQIGEHNGFVVFDSNRYGIRAACKLLETYWKKYHCRTIRDFISRWAPPCENPTDNYIQFVTDRFQKSLDLPSFSSDYVLGRTFGTSKDNIARLIKYMADFETPDNNIDFRTILYIVKSM